ncbi:Chaperone protein HscA [Arsenophonus endosymbiont of Bemisia tabaci Q2]|nr:Chaperone protein HscA [Arsenophonus endosymbiont of Bemisia tabaci Q2]
MVERRLAEQKVEAARVIESLMAALKQDTHLLNKEEKVAIDNTVNKLVNCTQESSSPVAIENTIKQLDKQTQDFAARRINISIRQALSGHSVDEI